MGDKNKSNTTDSHKPWHKVKNLIVKDNKYESQLTNAEKQENPERAAELRKKREEQATNLGKAGVGFLRKIDIIGIENVGTRLANLNKEAEKIKNSGGSNTDEVLYVGKEFLKATGSVAWGVAKASTGANYVPGVVNHALKSESAGKFLPKSVQTLVKGEDGSIEWVTNPNKMLIEKAKGMVQTKGPNSVNALIDIGDKIEKMKSKSSTELLQDALHVYQNKKGKVNVRESEVKAAAKKHAERVIVGGKAYKAPETKEEWNNAVRHSIRVHVDLAISHFSTKVGMQNEDWLKARTRNLFANAIFKLYLDESAKVEMPGENYLYSKEVIEKNEKDPNTNFPTVTHGILKSYSSVETINDFLEVYGSAAKGKLQLERLSMAYLKYLSYDGILDIPRTSETSTQSVNEGDDEFVTDKLDGSGQFVTKIIPDVSGLPFQVGETFFKVELLGEGGNKIQELEFSEYLGDDICKDKSYCKECAERDYIMDFDGNAGKFHADWQLNGDLHIRFYVEGLVDEYGKLERRGYRFSSSDIIPSTSSVKKVKLIIDKNKNGADTA